MHLVVDEQFMCNSDALLISLVEVCPLDIAASVLLSFPSDSFNVFIENLVHARAVISVSNMG